MMKEPQQSIHETVTSVKFSELTVVSNNIFKRYQVCLTEKEKFLSKYSDSNFFKQIIYFWK